MTENNASGGRSFAAEVFDQAATFATLVAKHYPGASAEANGFQIGASIARAIGRLIRASGADDVQKMVADLVAQKAAGVISDDDVDRDNEFIRDAVSDMYPKKDDPAE